ncbi:single-stranded DNA-binding protein [Bifidobacterium adolescentis]|uniref:Single-stranded DNA-binding protein n=1 Tax=Bifidobacterium adolescentis TaxID=1680 RepID=A0AAN5AFQ9_BIFAD|nr:single-stranded DNA-binding protein [Bifidobacterium adolescentis]GJD15028.1 single-stranded DNA-binding protein [Bifidobacterium adolescentis]
MAGETVITIVGNLTADPELRTTRNGGAVANFSIAATPRVFDKQSNQWVDGDALFMRCTAWRDLATHCAQSLAKGMRVIAHGRLTQHSWEDEQHQKRTAVELQVDEIGPSLRYATAQVQKMQSGGYQGGNANGGGYQQPQQARQQSQAPADDPWGAPAGEPDF